MMPPVSTLEEIFEGMARHFTVIGISDGHPPRLGDEAIAAIRSHKVFSGGQRHWEAVRDILPEGAEWIRITVPVEKVLQQYEMYGDIVVLASGDPLFYGFAATLRRRMPDAEIRVIPAMNSLQILAHRALLPYGEMRAVSLTGRPWHELDRALIEGCGMIGLLTDHVRTPRAIASRLVEYGYTEYRALIGERLGNPEHERVIEAPVTEVAGMDSAMPNCMILYGNTSRPPFGIPHQEFEGIPGRPDMITKMPVRLVSLAMLDLADRNCMWDIGFCTGSVSVEARLRFPHLHILAFEKCPERERLIEINSHRFRAPGIEWHIGDFLSFDLNSLMPPDAVFIGGHGGHLKQIVSAVCRVLAPGGTIVFNSVSESSLVSFSDAILSCGMRMDGQTSLQDGTHNPITILKAIKNEK